MPERGAPIGAGELTRTRPGDDDPDGLAARGDGSLVSRPERYVDDEPFGNVLADWLPLTYALNAVNRRMGRPDVYPFVLAPTVIRELAFVHRLVQAAGVGPGSPPAEPT